MQGRILLGVKLLLTGLCITSCHKEVITPNEIWAPTSFTPDGDGINDQFKIHLNNTNLQEDHLIIKNRLGTIAFESKLNNISWSGKDKDQIVVAGNYHWVLSYTDTLWVKKTVAGSVKLIQ